jgi:hypothetical protein
MNALDGVKLLSRRQGYPIKPPEILVIISHLGINVKEAGWQYFGAVTGKGGSAVAPGQAPAATGG